MKTIHFTQRGIGHIAVVFVLVFVAVVGLAGWKVMTMNKTADSVSTVTLSPKVPEKISTKADLVETSKALDSTNASVSSSLNDSALDSDLNDML